MDLQQKNRNYSARAYLIYNAFDFIKGSLQQGGNYDKQSSAMASVLDKYLMDLLKKAVKLSKKYKVDLPYAITEYKGNVWFGSGVGVSSLERALNFLGFKLKISSTITGQDFYVFIKE